MANCSAVRSMMVAVVALSLIAGEAAGQDTRATATYKRIKASLDAVPAIDTHDHIWPFDELPCFVETDEGRGANLAGLWRNSYYNWTNKITPWQPKQTFDSWWKVAKHDFANARATTFYRYQLPAFTDLYGVDFERMTDEEARTLNDRIFANYRDPTWLTEVVTKRANIELVFNDPYWAPYDFKQDYPFTVLVMRTNPLVRGFHPSEFTKPSEDPYAFARKKGLKLETLDDYVRVLDALFQEAKAHDAVCLKSTLAYQRSIDFANVPAERAARAFGRKREELTAGEIRDFEDFVMRRLVELSARYELPFQIHTGQARIQGSNPMLLVDLIAENPKTTFILFHGGYPWIGESAVIAMRHKNVRLDSCWLPTLSFSAAKRAYHEWLDVIPSNKIMWGADCNHAEGIYGATEFTRRALAEVLAERVDRGDLLEEHARRIGRQIMRDNALELFPQLKRRVKEEAGGE